MKDFFKTSSFKVLVIVVVVLLGLLIYTATAGGSVVASLLGFVTSPMQSVSTQVTGSVTEFVDLDALSRDELKEMVNSLSQENATLREQLVDYENTQKENEQLKVQLDITEDAPENTLRAATVIGRESGNYFSVSLTFYYKFIIFHRCLTSITFAVFGNIIDRKCQLPVTDRLVRMVRHSKIILAPILIYLTFRKRYLHFSVIRGKTFTVFRYYFFRRPWTKSCHQSKHQNTRPYFSYFLFHFPSPFPYLRSSYSFLVKR